MRSCGLLIVLLAVSHAAAAEGTSYWAYVACESEDEVAVVRVDVPVEGPPRASTVERVAVGVLDVEIEGPHGLAVSPDGKHWFVSMAHGRPFGTVYKYRTSDNQRVGEVELGMFPATMQVSPATGLLHVVNFNLHGDRKPSSVSIVDPEAMREVKRIDTGVMPHGSRFSPDGRRHYSLAMMTHELFEIDALELRISRRLKIPPAGPGRMAMPTWVQLHPRKPLAYVACNGSDEIAEIDLDGWQLRRRLPTGDGPYNVEITPDGRMLVASYKSEASTAIWDLESGQERARIKNTRPVTHGIAITPDSLFALVTVEGRGAQPGAVEVIDLQRGRRAALAEVGKQAGGIAFWKTTPLDRTDTP